MYTHILCVHYLGFLQSSPRGEKAKALRTAGVYFYICCFKKLMCLKTKALLIRIKLQYTHYAEWIKFNVVLEVATLNFHLVPRKLLDYFSIFI